MLDGQNKQWKNVSSSKRDKNYVKFYMGRETSLDRTCFVAWWITLEPYEWKEEWLENLREAGEGYKCYEISMRTTVMRFWRGQQKIKVHGEKVWERKRKCQKPVVQRTTKEVNIIMQYSAAMKLLVEAARASNRCPVPTIQKVFFPLSDFGGSSEGWHWQMIWVHISTPDLWIDANMTSFTLDLTLSPEFLILDPLCKHLPPTLDPA